MKFRPLGIEGAVEITPQQFGDSRGSFLEWYKHDLFSEDVGHPLDLRQANISVSALGAIRGIHFADVPPGQAKYVSCLHGAVMDVVVDIRVGSPTFGRWEAAQLDDVDRRSVYLAEGLGHGFCALTEGAVLAYLCSESYRPKSEHTINPLDPELGIRWPGGEPILSERDAAAPGLAEAAAAGLLPVYSECRDYISRLNLA